MKRQNVRTLSLIVCTLTYLMVGAAVFDALESETELKQRDQVNNVRNQLIRKYNISDGDYRLLETITVRAIPHKAGHQWKFSGAFYFATTVITTIGYGHSCPATIAGKIFTMFYALAGIPLGLVMFQSIGERLNNFAANMLRGAKRCCGKRPLVTHTDLIIICSALSVLLMAAGAFVFSRYERWSYLDALYYCFITLVTIGFGDFVALQQQGALEESAEYVVFTLVFIVFGLTLISAAMNLLVLRFLTMNSVDEKRDQKEAKLAAKGLVKMSSLEGRRKYSTFEGSDTSSSSSSSIHSSISSSLPSNDSNGPRKVPILGDPEMASLASCSCYQLTRGKGEKEKAHEHEHDAPTSPTGGKDRSHSLTKRHRLSVAASAVAGRLVAATQHRQPMMLEVDPLAGWAASPFPPANVHRAEAVTPTGGGAGEVEGREKNPFRHRRTKANPFKR